MKDWYSSIYKAFIVTSMITFLISFFSQGEVSLGASISGYVISILSIAMILLILFQNVLKNNENQGLFQFIATILKTSGPFLLMLFVIGFMLYLIINYKNLIVDNHISSGFYTFSNIAITLLLIQLYMVYTNISTPQFESTGKLSILTSSLLYLLGILTASCSLILFTILKYYTTDGFTIKNLH